MTGSMSRTLFQALTRSHSPADGLTDAARRAEPANGLRHVAALSMSKVADGLIDPKLVLSWLLTALGAPALLAGLLVPIREAGALVPQVVLAGPVARMTRRKWAWVIGSAGQGVAAALIAGCAFVLTGWAAGLAICALLGVLAVFRALCSVSYKDILGKTVGLSRRGAVTGLAGTAASGGVVIFALLLMSGALRQTGAVIAAVALAALLWGLAALVLATLREPPSQTGQDGGGVDFALLRDNPQLWRFIATRGLLVSTALAPPYLVILASDGDAGALAGLGALVLASAVASFLSSYVWGRLADRSSRRVLMLAGVLGALAMAGAVALAQAGLARTVWAMPAALFVLMIAYHGVRQGRSTYLVDMAPENRRAAYAAVANTAIGLILLATGVLGGLFAMIGPQATLAGFALMALAAAWTGRGLDEVEGANARQ
ncbi:MAG: MFS transporter [Rhodobacteraceae bacterium]|nr:MFS transporter [Paracoccaceae bacterium]